MWLLILAIACLPLLQPGWSGPGATTGVAYAADEVDLLNEGFDDMTVGTTPMDWGVNTSGSSYVRVEESGGRRYLQIYDASIQSTNGIGKTFGTETGKVVIQADIQLPAGGTPTKDNILFYVHDSAGRAAIALSLTTDKILMFRTVDGNTTATEVPSGLASGQWRRLTIAADNATKKYDLYIDNELVRSGVPFRYDDAANLNKLQITGAYYGDGSSNIRIANLDNVLIYRGDLRLLTPPTLIVDPEVYPGQAVDITFTDDAAWRAQISGVSVNQTAVSSATYSVQAGSLHLDAAALPATGPYMIEVRANGYVAATVTQQVEIDPELMLIEENFEAMTIGSTPADWGNSTTGNSSLTVEEASNGNRYLQLIDVSTQGSQGFLRTFPAQTGKVTVEADVQLPSGASEGKENILFYVRDTAGKSVIALSLTPTAIYSLLTTTNGTSSTAVASGLTAADWWKLKISADFTQSKFDFYVNGQLQHASIPFRYADGVNLGALLVAGAYYDDDQSYTRLVNIDNVSIYPRATMVIPVEPEPVIPPSPGVERYSFDSYSSVFLSSRWYAPVASGNKIGTQDALKRFMATDSKWTYEYNAAPIGNIVRLGVSFQGTFSMNMGQGGRAKLFDGTELIAPWMKWQATWGSMSDPVYYDIVLQSGKQSIDAGVTSFQFDDWRGSKAAYEMYGDFCDPCMERFRDYLDETYDDTQLEAWGIEDIASFNYKTYLQQTLNIYTNDDYGLRRTQSPLHVPFGDFMLLESKLFHERLHEDLEMYAGRELEFSVNTSILQHPLTKDHYLHDIFDYEIGETSELALQVPNMVAYGALASGLGKPQIISPLPHNPETVRHGIASAYALGQYMLVPWDVWLEGDTRYFGTVEEYGDLYHFIRQYSYLFDGHDVPAKVGLLVDWGSMSPSSLQELSMRLFEAGVPFRDIVANASSPSYSMSAEQFEGLETLIAYSPLSSFSSADQAVIAASGVPVIEPSAADEAWLSARTTVTIDGEGSELYATIRAEQDEQGAKSVHLLNRGVPAEDVTVTISDEAFYDGQSITAVLYRPGNNPLPLAVAPAGNGKRSIAVPELAEWGILRIQPVGAPAPGDYKASAPWSGYSVGSPVSPGSAELNGSVLEIASEGRGLHVPVSTDPGSADQLSYVYQKLEASPLQDAAISVKLLPLSSEASAGASAGVMIRETAASNSKFVAVSYVKGDGLKLQWRDTDNGSVDSTSLGDVTLPGYVKLERHAGTYSVYYSTDGIDWGSALGTHLNSSIRSPLAGAYVAAGSTGQAVTASFESLTASAGAIALPSGELSSLQLTGLPETMIVGNTVKLQTSAVVIDGEQSTTVDVSGEEIVYTSSDSAVAMVNRYGLVEARGIGTSTVTASFTVFGTTVTATATVTVTPPSPYLVDESFDSYDTETVPDGWTYDQITTYGSYIRVEPYPSATDRSLRVYDNTASGFPSAATTFELQTTLITVDFDFQVDLGADKTYGGAIVSYLQGADGTTSGVSLLVSDYGYWYLDGGTAVTVAPVIENQWQHFRIVAYPATKKMDLYIDGVQVVAQGNFRNPVDSIGKLTIGGSTGGLDTTARWNNLKVKRGLPDSSVSLRPGITGAWAPGETRSLLLGVNQSMNEQLSGVALTIDYDATKLSYVDSEPTDSAWTIVKAEHDAVEGKLKFVMLGLGEQAVATGSEDLLSVRFQVRSDAEDGVVAFTATQAIAGNPQGEERAMESGAWFATITTPTSGEVDKTALSAAISSADQLIAQAVEGTAVGQYIPGTLTAQRTALQLVLDAAKDVRDDAGATLTEVQLATTSVQDTVLLFESYRITALTGDLNGDGKIGIGDLTLIAYVYGKTQADTGAGWADISGADLNRDGVIDLSDLSFAAARWQGV